MLAGMGSPAVLKKRAFFKWMKLGRVNSLRRPSCRRLESWLA
jgi:hypothetical protein